MDFQNFLFFFSFPCFAFSSTFRTSRLYLLDHRSHSLNTNLHASSFTGWAFCRSSVGLFGNNSSLNGQLFGFSVVEVFQSDPEFVADVLTPSWATGPAATSEKHRENVVGISATASTLFESFESVSIISFTLLLILQNFIRCTHLFKLFFSVWAWIFVRVKFES